MISIKIFIFLLHRMAAWVKGGKMANQDNKIILEMNFKFQLKDYKLRFVTKRAWIVSIMLIIIKVLYLIYADSSP